MYTSLFYRAVCYEDKNFGHNFSFHGSNKNQRKTVEAAVLYYALPSEKET